MKITKFAHSCFLVEDKGTRVLFDPGEYSTSQNSLQNIQALIITHSHDDHFNLPNITEIMKNNPSAKIITNTEVAELLKGTDYKIEIVEEGRRVDIGSMKIRGIGNSHRAIYEGVQTPQCTGYIINDELLNTSDNMQDVNFQPRILIFPKLAPWLKISEFFDYIKKIKPQKVLPTHDGISKDPEYLNGPISKILKGMGIEYIPMELGREYDL